MRTASGASQDGMFSGGPQRQTCPASALLRSGGGGRADVATTRPHRAHRHWLSPGGRLCCWQKSCSAYN